MGRFAKLLWSGAACGLAACAQLPVPSHPESDGPPPGRLVLVEPALRCPPGAPRDDAALAGRLNLTVERLQRLKDGRGLSNDEVCALPVAKLARSYRKTDPNRPDHPAEAAAFRAMSLRDEFGNIHPHGLLRAVEQRRQLTVEAKAGGINSSGWTALGPGNIGGRVRGLAVHPTTPATLWLGGVSGGIWKSTDSGASWSPINDFLPNLLVTSILIDPSNPNVMYAGTGEVYAHISTDAGRGVGVYKSTDGGATWNRLTATDPAVDSGWRYVNRMAMHPTNTAVLLAATETGVYRSTDGGSSWSRTFTGRIKDVAFDPTDGSRAIYGGNAGQIGTSSDSGASWNTPVVVGAGGVRTSIAYAKSKPGRIYASIDIASGSVYRSDDHGVSWAQVANPRHVGEQGFHNNAIWVDPVNADRVVVGGIDLYRSSNGGSVFTRISTWQYSPVSPHADHHIIVHDPQYDGTSNRRVYIGNDGGIYKTDDILLANSSASAQTNAWSFVSGNLGITQYYGGAGAGNVIIGGTQDNGTLMWSGSGTNWTTIFGGDGGYVAVDPTNPDYLFGEYVYLQLFRSPNRAATPINEQAGGGLICQGITEAEKTPTTDSPPGCGGTGQANFIAPFILDPNNSRRMYAGAASLWVTDDNRAASPSWRAIKPPHGTEGNYISAIAVARGNPDVVWVGHNKGEVYRTSNATSTSPTWTEVSGSLPKRFVTRILIDKNNPQQAWVTLGGFTTGNVQRTTDNGGNWTDISSGLPQAPIRTITQHPGKPEWLYVGSEVGVFASENSGTSWSTTNDGPTSAPVDELFWPDSSTLVAATHGRGMFKQTVAGGDVVPQSGWWWNPAESGRGFFFERNSSGRAFMAGFLYADTGRATWFVATGAMSGSRFSSNMLTYANGQTLTGSYRAASATTSPGTVTIDFTSPTQGTMTWPGGTVSLQRFEFVSGGLSSPRSTGAAENGWWWYDQESGRGYAVEIQKDTVFACGFMYDDAGNPIWYLANSPLANATTYSSTWKQYANGQTLTGSYKPAQEVNGNVGSLGISWSSTTAGTMTLPDGRQIPFTRFNF